MKTPTKANETDINSFNLIANYIKESKYLHPPLSKIGSSNGVYSIIVVSDSTKDDLYLVERDFNSFFEPLKLLLKNKCSDKSIVEAFKYY